ncbi:MAG TPA: hypothetical protein VNT30_23200 [Stellaceae bacterium]|nr:hypothetical protein [Stellaceae bacterium]
MSTMTTFEAGAIAGAPALARTACNAGTISARLDRLPATWSTWHPVLLISFGLFFELYDVILSGAVTPGLVKSGILSANSVFCSLPQAWQ